MIELQIPESERPTANYAYIPALGRYYFIQDMVYRSRLWELYLSCDYLATYKPEIGASTLYVLRSASEFDGSIVDTLYPLKVAYTSSVTEQTEAAWWALAPTAATGAFIVGIRGRIDSSQAAGGVTYLVMTAAQFKEFTNKLFADDLGSYTGADPLGIADTLAKMIFNPAQYIASVMWLPGTPSQISGATKAWQVGFWNLDMLLPILNPASRLLYVGSVSLPAHPQASSRGAYMSAQPFTERLLYLPRVGLVPLSDPIFATAQTVTVNLQVDPISGEGIYSISAGGVTVDMIHCQIGVNVPLSSNEFTFEDAMGAVNGSLASASRAMSAADPEGTILGAGAGIGSALGILEPHIVTLSSASGYLGLVGAGECAVYSVFRQAPEDDNTEHGRPLCKNKQISTLSGYVQVLNGDIAIASATQTELDQIRAALESGFYYE